MASGSTYPCRKRRASSVMTPAFSSARSGRLTELCSRSVVTTWSPGRSSPLMARFSPSVQFMREDPALGRLAAEELVEAMTRVVEHSLRGDGHAVPRPPGVGQARAGEAVERLVDRLGLGKTGGGVVEVDHGRCPDWKTSRLQVKGRFQIHMANGRWQMAKDEWQMAKWQMIDRDDIRGYQAIVSWHLPYAICHLSSVIVSIFVKSACSVLLQVQDRLLPSRCAGDDGETPLGVGPHSRPSGWRRCVRADSSASVFFSDSIQPPSWREISRASS